MKYKCLIIDDEPPAHKVLENYIQRLDSLTLTGNCYSAFEAINFLHSNTVDLIFLDIEMPELSGLELLKTLNTNASIILTTAYSQFALDGFELGVIDYLLKPIRFERFLKAVNRLIEKKSPEKIETYFFVKSDGNQYKINFSDIHYFEAFGNFVKIHIGDKTILTSSTMTELLNRIPSNVFLRVHKSFILNINKIDKIEGNRIFINKQIVPIGNIYRSYTFEVLGI
jgi:DNA-binding LytR/AlgR family response regulator